MDPRRQSPGTWSSARRQRERIRGSQRQTLADHATQTRDSSLREIHKTDNSNRRDKLLESNRIIRLTKPWAAELWCFQFSPSQLAETTPWEPPCFPSPSPTNVRLRRRPPNRKKYPQIISPIYFYCSRGMYFSHNFRTILILLYFMVTSLNFCLHSFKARLVSILVCMVTGTVKKLLTFHNFFTRTSNFVHLHGGNLNFFFLMGEWNALVVTT